MDDKKNYNALFALSRKAQTFIGISHVLNWDQETYMPPGGTESRAEQKKALAELIHKMKTEKKFTSALAKLVDIESGKIIATSLPPRQKAAIREWHHDYTKAKALPGKFVAEFAKVTSQSVVAWRHAKHENDYHSFKPHLKKVIEMVRKKADYYGYTDHPYDSLLDEYEPGAKTKDIDRLFSELKSSILPLIKKISQAKQVDDSFLHGHFPDHLQMNFGRKVLIDIGFDAEHGRLDLSEHPFSTSPHPSDNRITTRLHTDMVASSISTVLHEAGHGLYENGLPAEEYGSPLGEPVSLGIHESQSRWYETRIGKSMPFWQHYLPLLKKTFPQLDKVSLDAFYQGINKVTPSFIRVEADEVTYQLHVILRFELEKALIEGSLSVDDLPEAWNAKMQEFLGITPKTYSQGCLQDIHWPSGFFGYFPTYTLGNLYASQMFEAFKMTHPDWDKKIAGGEFLFIRNWLHDNVYAYGREYSSLELVKKISGKPFTAQPFNNYLNTKFGDIYQLT